MCLLTPCAAAAPGPQQLLVQVHVVGEAGQEVAAEGECSSGHKIQDTTYGVVSEENVWEDGQVDEGMQGAATSVGVHGVFVAVGMNEGIKQVAHAYIINMEISSLIGFEELSDVEVVEWRRTECGCRHDGTRFEINRKQQGSIVCSLVSMTRMNLQSCSKRSIRLNGKVLGKWSSSTSAAWFVVGDEIKGRHNVLPSPSDNGPGSRGILQARTLALEGIARNRCKTPSQ